MGNMFNIWNEKEKEAINRVISSGMYTMGKEVTQFEKDACEFFGSKYAVMVNSGSSANLLAVAALFFSKKFNMQRGDEVIVPAVSWATTFSPLQQYGLKLVFVDIDAKTLNIDIEKVKAAINPKTKMIAAVNLLGNSVDYRQLKDICIDKNIALFEDNCESMGGKLDGKFLGTYGDIGTFSTFFSHHICTMEGGFALTDNKELYELMLCIRAHGWTRNLPSNSEIHTKKENDFYELFNFVLPGYNLRPLEIEAAIGIEQLKKLPLFVEKRRENAKKIKKIFDNVRYIITQEEFGESSWFGFSIILTSESPFTRDELVQILAEQGITSRPIVSGNFLRNEAIKYFEYEVFDNIKNADYLHENGLFIWNGPVDMDDTIEKLRKIFL